MTSSRSQRDKLRVEMGYRMTSSRLDHMSDWVSQGLASSDLSETCRERMDGDQRSRWGRDGGRPCLDGGLLFGERMINGQRREEKGKGGGRRM